jgi:hypothetical protein
MKAWFVVFVLWTVFGWCLTVSAVMGNDVPDDVPVYYVERAERNHFYDSEGRQVFVQWLVWKWRPEIQQYAVDGWRLERFPTNNKFGDVAVFPGFLVRAKQWDETWTQFDPELADRERWPEELRAQLPGDWERCRKPSKD